METPKNDDKKNVTCATHLSQKKQAYVCTVKRTKNGLFVISKILAY